MNEFYGTGYLPERETCIDIGRYQAAGILQGTVMCKARVSESSRIVNMRNISRDYDEPSHDMDFHTKSYVVSRTLYRVPAD